MPKLYLHSLINFFRVNLMNKSLTKTEEKLWLDYEQSFNSEGKKPVHNEFWSYGEFELVGHGKQTNSECGKFKRFDGCLNVESHNAARWLNPDLKKDSVFIKSVYHSCDKPTCPKVF